MALIMEPARELAQQTHDNITRFKKHLTNPGIRYFFFRPPHNSIELLTYIANVLSMVTPENIPGHP